MKPRDYQNKMMDRRAVQSKAFRPGQRVRYVPGHAHGIATESAAHDGSVTSVENGCVYVTFDSTPSAAQSCDPMDLIGL